MQNLKKILESIFLKSIVFPLFGLSIVIITILLTMRGVMFKKIEQTELEKNRKIVINSVESKGFYINQRFNEIFNYAKLLQKEHEIIFEHKKIKEHLVEFNVAKNGVFYKVTKKGSSLYYSSDTKIGKKEREKAIFTEDMDHSFKELVDNNNLVVQVYFNSFDGMNRLYPFVDEVYKKFGKTIRMQDYNFYYLADKTHDPKREPVWTKPYLDPAGKGWMISCVFPIYTGDFLEGVSGIDVTIEKIREYILSQFLPFKTKMMLVNRDGTIIALPKSLEKLLNLKELTKHNYTSFIKKTIKKPKIFNIKYNKNRLTKEIYKMLVKSLKYKTVTTKSGDFFITIAQLPNLDSYIVSISKKDDLLATIDSLRFESLKIISSIILLLIILILIFYLYSFRKFKRFSNKITYPLELLTKMVESVEKDAKVPHIDTKIKEISILFKKFVLMIKEIKEKESKLKELNVNLEQEVQNATHELVIKNRELTEAVTNFQTIFDLTLEMIVFIKDGKIVDINSAGLKMTNYNSKSEIVGKDFTQFVPKEEIPKIAKAFQMDSSEPYETTLIDKNGRYLNVLASGKYIHLSGQKVRLSTIIDITEIKAKDKMLFLQAKQAQLGEMVRMIAHHWRQPINSISATSIDMTIKKELGELSDDEFFQANEFIQQECQKISKTIDDFLEFSKSGNKNEEFPLHEIVERVINIVSPELSSFNISLKTLDKDGNLKIKGYKELLEQVILNLISNAKDAYNETKKSKKEIIVCLHKNKTITITDYAGGVDKENREKLFIPYFTTKEQGKGVGLGLYLSRRIMREHFNGDLIYKNFKYGSTFILKFGGENS